MINLSNGNEVDFLCASGSLGFCGDGWWWEQPLRWVGMLRPHEFTHKRQKAPMPKALTPDGSGAKRNDQKGSASSG